LIAQKQIKPISPLAYPHTPSLLESSAEMKGNIHVCSSGMMNKAMSAHGCAISAVMSKLLL
jgi:hypothetical protein